MTLNFVWRYILLLGISNETIENNILKKHIMQ